MVRLESGITILPLRFYPDPVVRFYDTWPPGSRVQGGRTPLSPATIGWDNCVLLLLSAFGRVRIRRLKSGVPNEEPTK